MEKRRIQRKKIRCLHTLCQSQEHRFEKAHLLLIFNRSVVYTQLDTQVALRVNMFGCL